MRRQIVEPSSITDICKSYEATAKHLQAMWKEEAIQAVQQRISNAVCSNTQQMKYSINQLCSPIVDIAIAPILPEGIQVQYS